MVRTMIVTLIVLMAAVAVLGTEEIPRRDARPEEIANPMKKLFPVLMQGMQGLAGSPNDANFPCDWCTRVVLMLYNMTVDPTFGEFIEKFMETYACDYWAPGGFKEYCLNYVRGIPDLIKDWADTYMNPKLVCAPVCKGRQVVSHPNEVPNVFSMKKKMKAAGGF